MGRRRFFRTCSAVGRLDFAKTILQDEQTLVAPRTFNSAGICLLRYPACEIPDRPLPSDRIVCVVSVCFTGGWRLHALGERDLASKARGRMREETQIRR